MTEPQEHNIDGVPFFVVGRGNTYVIVDSDDRDIATLDFKPNYMHVKVATLAFRAGMNVGIKRGAEQARTVMRTALGISPCGCGPDQ